MNFEEFKENVESWAAERGIYEHSTPEAQLLKTLSELGELADAVIKGDREGLKDAIGDVAVCVVNYTKMKWPNLDLTDKLKDYFFGANNESVISSMCTTLGQHLNGDGYTGDTIRMIGMIAGIAKMNGLDFLECCNAAWDEIKDRKGFLSSSGAFVKEEDLV